jgi:hypothetical protein
VIGALEDAQDYKAFEATIIADYDAQSAVERELVLRLASLLWRLRRATTMETGLFEIQADHLRQLRQARQVLPASRELVDALSDSVNNDPDPASRSIINVTEALPSSEPNPIGPAIDPALTLRVAFCVLPICPISLSIASAGMKQPCGAKLAVSYMRSTPWIVANHKKEGAATASTSVQNCRLSGATMPRRYRLGFRVFFRTTRDRD